jgi:hypothetical protein
MDDDEKAELARKGLGAADLLEPGKIGEKVKGAVADAASRAALTGVAALGALTGKTRSPARQRAAVAVDIGSALAEWDAADGADFDRRVRAAATEKATADEAARLHLAELRRSFPPASRELAVLVFNCVDLLEDLSDDAEGEPDPPATLERKEKVLQHLAQLIAPDAGAALTSFVDHVVALSRQHRGT